MWAVQLDLVAAFCVSAIIVFVASLGIMMLVVYMRKPKPVQFQSQGQACDNIYVPTTLPKNSGSQDVVKPLLIGLEKVTGETVATGIYPTKELTPLKEGMDHQMA